MTSCPKKENFCPQNFEVAPVGQFSLVTCFMTLVKIGSGIK
jgi:hypothetical protein